MNDQTGLVVEPLTKMNRLNGDSPLSHLKGFLAKHAN